MPSKLNIESLKVAQLKEELKKRGLSTAGLKLQLVQKLQDALSRENEVEKKDAADEKLSTEDGVSLEKKDTADEKLNTEDTVSHSEDKVVENTAEASKTENNNNSALSSSTETEDKPILENKEGETAIEPQNSSVLGAKRPRDEDEKNTTEDVDDSISNKAADRETGEVATKRPRVEEQPSQQQQQQSNNMNGSQAAAFLGGGVDGKLKSEEFVNPTTNMVQLKIYVPAKSIGCVIGRGGSLVKNTRNITGCGMQIPRDDTNGAGAFRVVIIDGMRPQVEHARTIVEGQVAANLLEAKRRVTEASSSQNNSLQLPTKQLQIPNEKTGGLIGRGGSVIKWLRNASMCGINIQNNNEVPPGATVRIVTLQGTQSQIDHAEQLILQKLSEVNTASNQNRMSMGGPNTQTTQVSVPQEHVGRIIGKAGSHLKHIREQTGCNVHVEKGQPGDQLRTVTFNGTLQQIQQAQYLISAKMQESQKYQQQTMMGGVGAYNHPSNSYGNGGYGQQYNTAMQQQNIGMQQRQYPYGHVNTYQTPYGGGNNIVGAYNAVAPGQQQQTVQHHQHRYNATGYAQNNMYGTYGGSK
jgi:far upstream element-binding protein